MNRGLTPGKPDTGYHEFQLDIRLWEKARQLCEEETGRPVTDDEVNMWLVTQLLFNKTAARLVEEEQRLSLEERKIVHDYLKRCVEDGTEIGEKIEGEPTVEKILREARKIQEN